MAEPSQKTTPASACTDFDQTKDEAPTHGAEEGVAVAELAGEEPSSNEQTGVQGTTIQSGAREAGTVTKGAKPRKAPAAPTSKQRTVAPGERGGRPRGAQGDRHTPSEIERLRGAVEVVCRKQQWQWMLGVELPDDAPDVEHACVVQNEEPLEQDPQDPQFWWLREICGEVAVQPSQENESQGRGRSLRDESVLVFKLAGPDFRQGRLTQTITSGSYLAVVPAAWHRDEARAGPPPVTPEPTHLDGYLAHYFDLSPRDGNQIAFQAGAGKQVVLPRKSLDVELVGRRFEQTDDQKGPFFLASPPRLRAARSEVWAQIPTFVLGQAGSGRRRWRTVFTPDPQQQEQDFPEDLARRGSGWYFVRFYDSRNELVDSLDFRFAVGLSDVRIVPEGPLPVGSGHRTTTVTVAHEPAWTIEPAEDLAQGVVIEKMPGETRILVPPEPVCDHTRWRATSPASPPVDFTIVVPRLWWGVADEGAQPEHWQAVPLELNREDLLATSEKALWLRLPRGRPAGKIRVGFSENTALPLRAGGPLASLPLREFCDSEALARPGDAFVSIWLADGHSAEVAHLRLHLVCRQCGFSADDEDALIKHIRTSHVDELFPMLKYPEVRDRLSDRLTSLPHHIYQCLRCDYYVTSDDPLNPTSAITSHILYHCPAVQGTAEGLEKSFRVVEDIDEVRQFVVANLPRIYRCTLCGCEFEEPSQDDLARHLLTKHRQRMCEVR